MACAAAACRVPGVVETSNNLGMVDAHPPLGQRATSWSVRCSTAAALPLADEIVSLFALSGTRPKKSGHYPGWAPNPASPLLARSASGCIAGISG
jgi:dipeptidase D